MDTHLTRKKRPAGLVTTRHPAREEVCRGAVCAGRGDGDSLRAHNLCSLEAVGLVWVEVLVTHTPPQLDDHADQDEQHEHRGADEQPQVELGFSEVEHGSTLLGWLWAWLLASKNSPVDIGAQVFAAHGPGCRALDRGAVLGGHASAGLPHARQTSRYTYG